MKLMNLLLELVVFTFIFCTTIAISTTTTIATTTTAIATTTTIYEYGKLRPD